MSDFSSIVSILSSSCGGVVVPCTGGRESSNHESHKVLHSRIQRK